MKVHVNRFTDDFKFKVVQEYLETSISLKDLMDKHQIKGHSCVNNWIRKFAGSNTTPNRRIMKQRSQSINEDLLEQKIKNLEEELKREQFKTLALNTMINIAERELKVDIRKKPGAKR